MDAQAFAHRHLDHVAFDALGDGAPRVAVWPKDLLIIAGPPHDTRPTTVALVGADVEALIGRSQVILEVVQQRRVGIGAIQQRRIVAQPQITRRRIDEARLQLEIPGTGGVMIGIRRPGEDVVVTVRRVAALCAVDRLARRRRVGSEDGVLDHGRGVGGVEAAAHTRRRVGVEGVEIHRQARASSGVKATALIRRVAIEQGVLHRRRAGLVVDAAALNGRRVVVDQRAVQQEVATRVEDARAARRCVGEERALAAHVGHPTGCVDRAAVVRRVGVEACLAHQVDLGTGVVERAAQFRRAGGHGALREREDAVAGVDSTALIRRPILQQETRHVDDSAISHVDDAPSIQRVQCGGVDIWLGLLPILRRVAALERQALAEEGRLEKLGAAIIDRRRALARPGDEEHIARIRVVDGALDAAIGRLEAVDAHVAVADLVGADVEALVRRARRAVDVHQNGTDRVARILRR